MTSIVLVHPEIPGNTGAVGRTCVALDLELVLIHPLGFDISDRRVKRSGLDYWQHIRLCEFASWDAFVDARQPRDGEWRDVVHHPDGKIPIQGTPSRGAAIQSPTVLRHAR